MGYKNYRRIHEQEREAEEIKATSAFGEKQESSKKKSSNPDKAYWMSLFTDINKFPEFCEVCLRIKTKKGGQLLPFRLNLVQLWLFNFVIKPLWIARTPIRLIILKARQHGCTTFMNAFIYWCTLGHNNWGSLLIGKKLDQSKVIFRTISRFIKNMPTSKGCPDFLINNSTKEGIHFRRPDERVQRIDPARFKWPIDLDSTIDIRSGEDREDLGRADNYHSVLASEAAYWPELSNSLHALLECAHEYPETFVGIETTANGMNEFQQLWDNESFEGVEIDDMWKRVFLPYYWLDEYEYADPEGKMPRKFLNTDEEVLFTRIIEDKIYNEQVEPEPITIERAWHKIFWRRRRLINNFRGNVEKFKQEFPSHPEEAFRFSGKSVFRQHVPLLLKHIKEPKWKCDVSVVMPIGTQNAYSKDHKKITQWDVAITENERGRLHIWKMPEENQEYAVAVDVAQGLANDDEGIDENLVENDFSVIQVLKLTPFPPIEQVACYHGSCDPHTLGLMACVIANMYNNALLSWDVLGIGIALEFPIVQMVGYPNLYMRVEEDSLTHSISKKAGFKSTWGSTGTKYNAIEITKEFILEGALIVHDASTLNEMKSYSQLTDRKFGAAKGHDDRISALMQGAFIVHQDIHHINRRAEVNKEKEKKKITKLTGGQGWAWEKTKKLLPYIGLD